MVEGDERNRLHEIVDALHDEELSVARQLLELLAKGRATPTVTHDGQDGLLDGTADVDDDDEEDEDAERGPEPSPETIAKLTQLTDHELLHLDSLLQNDPAGARHLWRERFGEELEDEGLLGG
jgi:hypothetical protein